VAGRLYRDGMGKRQWATVAGVLVALAALTGAGVLLVQHWDTVVSVVLSPIGGIVVKILFGGKLLKVLAVAGFAVVAGAVAVRRRLRRSRDPQPLGDPAAPPVYGPPEPPAPAPQEQGREQEQEQVPAR
jgi:hypothetical protein